MTQYKTLNVKLTNSRIKNTNQSRIKNIKSNEIKNKNWYSSNFKSFIKWAWSL